MGYYCPDGLCLLRDPENRMDELPPADDGITFRQPAELSLPYRMHRLVTLDCSQSIGDRTGS